MLNCGTAGAVFQLSGLYGLHHIDPTAASLGHHLPDQFILFDLLQVPLYGGASLVNCFLVVDTDVDFRLLFLFTALCPEQRAVARHNHAAVEIQLKVIRDIIRDGEESVNKESALVICEVLKV